MYVSAIRASSLVTQDIRQNMWMSQDKFLMNNAKNDLDCLSLSAPVNKSVLCQCQCLGRFIIAPQPLVLTYRWVTTMRRQALLCSDTVETPCAATTSS